MPPIMVMSMALDDSTDSAAVVISPVADNEEKEVSEVVSVVDSVNTSKLVDVGAKLIDASVGASVEKKTEDWLGGWNGAIVIPVGTVDVDVVVDVRPVDVRLVVVRLIDVVV